MSYLMMLFALECIVLIEMILTIFVEQKQTTQDVLYIIDSFVCNR